MAKKQNNLSLAKTLRRNLTPAELKLWRAIQNKSLSGHKFRKQVPIEKYIVDFLCYEKRLIVELDGYSHDLDSIHQADQIRDDFLNQQGFTILRFSNNQILKELEFVLMKIEDYLSAPSPKPLCGFDPPARGGLK